MDFAFLSNSPCPICYFPLSSYIALLASPTGHGLSYSYLGKSCGPVQGSDLEVGCHGSEQTVLNPWAMDCMKKSLIYFIKNNPTEDPQFAKEKGNTSRITVKIKGLRLMN